MRGMDGGSELDEDFSGAEGLDKESVGELLKIDLSAHADTPFVRSLMKLVANGNDLHRGDFSDMQILRGEDLRREPSNIGSSFKIRNRIDLLQERVETFVLEPQHAVNQMLWPEDTRTRPTTLSEYVYNQD